MRIAALGVFIFLCSAAFSATQQLGDTTQISPFGQGDHRQLRNQRDSVNALCQRYLGRRLSGNKTRDLDTLQTLLDRDVIRAGQTLELQAMGVVLGDLMAAEHRLKWVIYSDEHGRSRALQMDDRQVFLFPITMISRRVDAGLEVDIAKLYETAVDEIRADLNRRYKPEPPIR